MRLRWVAGWCGVGCEVNGFESVGATQAHGGVVCVVAYVFGEAPAAFTLRACCGFGLNIEGSFFYGAFGDNGVGDFDLGYAEEFGKYRFVLIEDRVGFFGDVVEPAEDDLGLGGFVADGFGGASLFEDLEDFVAEGEELVPVFFELASAAGDDLGQGREEREMDAGFAVR